LRSTQAQLTNDRICHDGADFQQLDKREKAQLALRLSLAHTLPQVLCRKTTYCSALYLAAVVLAASLFVAQAARVSAAARTVVDMLNLTTASGLEQ